MRARGERSVESGQGTLSSPLAVCCQMILLTFIILAVEALALNASMNFSFLQTQRARKFTLDLLAIERKLITLSSLLHAGLKDNSEMMLRKGEMSIIRRR